MPLSRIILRQEDSDPDRERRRKIFPAKGTDIRDTKSIAIFITAPTTSTAADHNAQKFDPKWLQAFVHKLQADDFHKRPGKERNPDQHKYQNRGPANRPWNTEPQQRASKIAPDKSSRAGKPQEWQSAEHVNLGMRNHCCDREGHCGRKQRQDGDEKQQPAHVHSFLGSEGNGLRPFMAPPSQESDKQRSYDDQTAVDGSS